MFKKPTAIVLVVCLLFSVLPLPPFAPVANAQNVPVWKIAFVAEPLCKVNGKQMTLTNDQIQKFFDSADLFKMYIEQWTDYAVEIQISKIRSDLPLGAFGHAFYPANYFDHYEKYDLWNYDMVFVGTAGDQWASITLDFLVSGLNLNDPFSMSLLQSGMFPMIPIHEFMHFTEYAFSTGKIGGFGIPDTSGASTFYGWTFPYEAPTGEFPSHSYSYYGYPFIYDDVGYTFMRDWFGGKIKDPKNPSRLLGMHPTMWNYKPTDSDLPRRLWNPIRTPFTIPEGDHIVPNLNKSDDVVTQDGYIDLDAEKLITREAIGSYSVNGGRSWKKGVPNISKLLAKPMTLWVGGAIDQKTKSPTGNIVKFPAISARPKAPKLKLNYAEEGVWTTSKTDGLEVARAPNGKVKNLSYQPMPTNGVAVGKTKTVYFARVAVVVNATHIVPASKPTKITPKTEGKAPNLKPNKENILKLKPTLSVEVNGKMLSSTPATLDLSQYAAGKTLTIWFKATAKRPASAKQTLKV